jgi:hypothetical protein
VDTSNIYAERINCPDRRVSWITEKRTVILAYAEYSKLAGAIGCVLTTGVKWSGKTAGNDGRLPLGVDGVL